MRYSGQRGMGRVALRHSLRLVSTFNARTIRLNARASMSELPPIVTERVVLPGPVGNLEGIVDQPTYRDVGSGERVGNIARPTYRDVGSGEPVGSRQRPPVAPVERVAILCHPHPQFGGTMTNKVVHMLAKACNDLGAAAVRFNYRGVGTSAGSYDQGNGETDDTLAAIDWAQRRWPHAQLWLGGFSFGGAVAMKAASRRTPRLLMTVAPAVQRVAVDSMPTCPWLVVQGDSDELVDAVHTQAWIAALAAPPVLKLLPGVDHFFHGRLTELREIVVQWAGSQDPVDAPSRP